MTTDAEPRRLVSADYARMNHEALIAALTRSGEPYVTVELSRNAKGETQHSVKISAPVGHDLEALASYAESVRAEAVASYERTSMRFPTNTGTVTNDAPPTEAGKAAIIAAVAKRQVRNDAPPKGEK